MYSFPDLEPVCCSMSSSNCCFLTCIQISQEAGQLVWCSHIFKNFPQFVVIVVVNKSIAQLVKNLPSVQETPWFDPRVEKIPWKRKWQPTSVSLPGKSHVQRSLVGCSPWGHKESGTTERLTLTYLHLDVFLIH